MHVPSPTSRTGKRVYLSLWDLFWALVSPIIALFLRDPEGLFSNPDWSAVVYYWGLSSGFALLAFFALRIQDGMTRYFSVQEALDIVEAALFAELMTCGVMFTLTRLDGIPRSMPIIHGILLAAGLIAARFVVRIVNSAPEEPPDYRTRRERTLIIGANPFAASFIQLLKFYAPAWQPVIALLDDDAKMVGRAVAGVQVLGAPHELETVVAEFSIHGVTTDRVVIAGEADFLSPTVLHEIERICKKRQIELCFLPRMIGVTEWAAPAKASSPQPVADLEPGIAVPAYFRFKRTIDVFASLMLLVVLSPLMLIGGLLVLLDVGAPILFWQERLGWKRRAFLIYKFRTLRAPFGPDGKATGEGREPSAIGRFLRATRIDELPQLLNVLLGDMSLIGPRPLLPEDQPSGSHLRLSVRPGITGWAQVHGAKLVGKDEKEQLDEWYIRNASLLNDLRIVAMTVSLLMKSHLLSRETAADAHQVKARNIGLSHAMLPSEVAAESSKSAA
jgi:lipopolysaccharide/colanic/teichoic acid biosynthesis glycosyltransferase